MIIIYNQTKFIFGEATSEEKITTKNRNDIFKYQYYYQICSEKV